MPAEIQICGEWARGRGVDASGQQLRLFIPFYNPPQADRKKEIVRCVLSNIASNFFVDIILFVDNEQDLEVLGSASKYVSKVALGRKPSYADWIREEIKWASSYEAISVFANADIIFRHEFPASANSELSRNRTILCVSRHEWLGGELSQLHAAPHWSQDAWCIRSADAKAIDSSHLEALNIKVGTPRCDNRIAYIFWLHNWRLINPCNRLKILHHHQSNVRSYDKKDRTVLGGVAYVHPSSEVGQASTIDVDIYTLSAQSPAKLTTNAYLINPSASKPKAEIAGSMDLPWQNPNRTERHAFEQLCHASGQLMKDYLPYPWASWIDRQSRSLTVPEPPQGGSNSIGFRVRASVCQHIWALDQIRIFKQAGVTDLFWSHATAGTDLYEGIRIHPFPLYPVRCVSHPPNSDPIRCSQRRFLYSFQGAYSPGLYQTAVRHWIAKLPQRPDACVAIRPEWHFEQEVYREQVHGETSDSARAMELAQDAAEYARTLQESCFVLCPSGSGPNSIRLWEALGYGAVPVILSDDLLLPGDQDLWRQAALFVPETEGAISALPAQLEQLAARPGHLDAMQTAGQQLWQRYGPDIFVADVAELLHSPEQSLLVRARQQLGEGCELLVSDEPCRLVRQVQRWRRVACAGSALIIQIRDESPGDLQEVRWRSALSLCQSLLAGYRWRVSSLNPRLEELAAKRR